MKKTLRKKFILFAMSAVTLLLAVLIGAINALSWVILDRQSDHVLHALASGEDKPFQGDFRDFHGRGPFMPPMNMDTIKSARFFMVHMDAEGNVLDVNIDQIFSVTADEAAQYARQIKDTAGKLDAYKYEVKQMGADRLIFFMDTTGQIGTFVMVFTISSGIAFVCWLLTLLFVTLFSERVVRPVLAGMEKQKQFITNAGHELKTPLAIIQSNNDAATLIHGETKYSKNIRLQTQRLNVLMTNLLTLAKLDEEAELPTETVDISELICGMLSSYEEAIAEKQMTVSAKIQPDVMMRVHKDTFSQMISILFDNAVKYTPNGGTIHFSLMEHDSYIEIREENTCNDPPDSDPERLFERFYRGDNSRTQSNPSSGYGIGLSAARAIAETFGGRLTANYTDDGKLSFTARF